MEWIVVPNWDELQHYKKRSPPWIKNYTRLVANPTYRNLTDHQRALLHGLWLIYALSDGCLPLDIKLINTWLALTTKMRSLEALRDAGFIVFSASKPLALRARTTEREKEKEKERTVRATESGLVPRENGASPFYFDPLKSVDEVVDDRR